MIGAIFAAVAAIILALGFGLNYYRAEAAQVAPLRTALDRSIEAIDKQGKAINAMQSLREITDGLYQQATAERTEGVRVITVYREKQREDARNDPLVAQWGAARVPDAVIERLQRHDARYREATGADNATASNDRPNTSAGRASAGRQQ